MIKKYKKKPIIIEAIQLTSDNARRVVAFCEGNAKMYFQGIGIQTLEETMLANVGDYIIKGAKGEFYPCKPDIFELTYDEVQTNDN